MVCSFSNYLMLPIHAVLIDSIKKNMFTFPFAECGVEKKIQCKLCFKKFRRKWNLEQHQKRIHRKHYNDEHDTVIRYGNENDLNTSEEKSNS